MQKLINLLSEYIATLPGFLFLVLILLLCISVFSWRTNQLKLGTEGESKLLDSRFWYIPKDVQEFFDYIDTNAGKVGLNLYALMLSFQSHMDCYLLRHFFCCMVQK